PDDYFGYVKIDSITSAYNNLIDLRAADIILSQEKLRQVYKTLLEFRNSKLSNNKFLTSLLNMNVNIVLKKDYSPVFLVDLGFKSIILRSSRFITKFVERRENFSLDEFKNKDKKYTIYRLYIYSNQQEFYFSIHKNLLFFALQKEDIDNLYDVKMNGNNIYNDDNYYFIKKQIKKGGIAEIYYNTDEVIKPLLKKMAGVNNIIKKLKLDTNSAISFNISNDDLFFSSFTKSSTQDEKLQNFLENNAGKLDIIQYLPDDTNLYTAINIQSFEEFYKLFLYLQEGGYEKTIEKIDNACQVFFKMSIDEIIFSWIGSEIGAFTSTISSSPVIFLKIKDKKQNKMVFDKLVSSILLEDSNLNFDGVNLNKISFPDFLQSIIRNFAASFDTPYYTIIEDFIFFSMDPASLVNMVKKYDEELTLNYDNVYRDITSKVEKKATLFLYFNLGTTSHKLLQGKTFIPKLLKLYEKGVLTINLDNSSIRLDLAAAGINIKKTHLFPGYPKKIESVISSPVICRNITGSGLDELIYTTQNNKLMVADINNNSIGDFPVRIDGINKIAPIINDLDNNGELEIYVFTEKGTLHKYDTKGYKEAPYPISTEFKGSPAPVLYNGKLIFYSKNDKKIYFLKSNKKEEFNFEFKTPLLSPITISKNTFAFYPKSFNGTIFLTNDAGKTLNGWPND
ncbi:MAG: hypothetical protein KAT05_09955, partial [Spirochaetes bacterium]|nr:hypothetical protein [Spirochaetota bacterium]